MARNPNDGLQIIVAFDLGKETFGEVLEPVYDRGYNELILDVLGERLCVLCEYFSDRMDIWVMEVY